MIPEAETFKSAVAAYREYSAKSEELNLDLKIAERQQDDDAIRAAKAALVEHSRAWLNHYRGREEAAKALVAALGIEANDLKYAL